MSIADISPQAMSALKEQREQLWGSIDAILEENERLRSELAESSVAVEVPELDPGANPNQRNIDNPGSFGWVVHHEYRKGYECARKIANDAISSRLLKDGHVQVPEPTVQQWLHEVLDPAEADPDPHATMRHAIRWFRENAHAIDPSRILKDGHVQVPETDVAMIRRCLDECAWDDILQPIVDWTDRMSDALRSTANEGREG